MKIRMLIQLSGPRGDGQDWPGPHSMGGGTIVVGDGEGRDLIRAGIAEEVPEPEPAPVKLPKAPVETRSAVTEEEDKPAEEEDKAAERAVVETPVETRAPVGLTTQTTPVTRPRAARARST